MAGFRRIPDSEPDIRSIPIFYKTHFKSFQEEIEKEVYETPEATIKVKSFLLKIFYESYFVNNFNFCNFKIFPLLF